MGPFIKSNNSTKKIMKHLFISLIPIIIFTFIKNGLIPYKNGYTNIIGLFYPLIFITISIISTFTFETLYLKLFEKKQCKFKELIKNSYSIFPGLFLALILPINTPIIILVLGAFISSIIAKMLFGGFGNNIFNPALVGRLFIIATYSIVIGSSGGYLNKYELDTISSSTPLTNLSTLGEIGTYETVVKPYGNLKDFFIGTIPGAVGETSSLLCLLALAYLIIVKAIKWKIPVVYISTVFAITYVIGGMNDLGIWYPLFHVFSGGLMFGAVFMATDPVTSPVTPIGQVLYGLFLGILTVIFRFLTPFPEGVLTSILTMNMFVFILDKIGSLARFDFKITFIPFIIAWVMIIGLSIGISINYTKKNTETDPNYNIISKTTENNKTTYIATQKGYSSTIKAQIVIENNNIIEFTILEQNESFYSKINEQDYINKLKQNNVDDVDTITGATITSNALKKLLKNTINDYNSNNKENINNENIGNENTNNENNINPPAVQSNFAIISKNVIGENTVEYITTNKGFSGNIKLQVILTNGVITSVNVLEQNDSYFNIIEENNYINTIITNQANINELDTISGVTYTSKGIKESIIEIMNDYNLNGAIYE